MPYVRTIALVLGVLVYLTALVRKPHPLRWAFWPAMMCCFYIATVYRTHNPALENVFGLAVGNVALLGFDHIILTEVQREFWVVGKGREELADISTQPLTTRFRWALRLLASQSGLGWNWAPRDIQSRCPPPGTSRARFLRNQFGRVIVELVLMDLFTTYDQSSDGWIRESWNRSGPLNEMALWRRVADLLSMGLNTAISFDVMYIFISMVHVSLWLSSPEDWLISSFGSLTDAYTVRRFWSRVWHIFLRRPLAAPGSSLFPRNKTLQLFTAFFVSSILHGFGELTMNDLKVELFGSMIFFWAQPFLILTEEVTFYLAKRCGVKNSWIWRPLGYCWVVACFTVLMPIWWIPMVDRGSNPEKEKDPVQTMTIRLLKAIR